MDFQRLAIDDDLENQSNSSLIQNLTKESEFKEDKNQIFENETFFKNYSYEQEEKLKVEEKNLNSDNLDEKSKKVDNEIEVNKQEFTTLKLNKKEYLNLFDINWSFEFIFEDKTQEFFLNINNRKINLLNNKKIDLDFMILQVEDSNFDRENLENSYLKFSILFNHDKDYQEITRDNLCVDVYVPVCGKLSCEGLNCFEEKTFKNLCFLEEKDAILLYSGECRDNLDKNLLSIINFSHLGYLTFNSELNVKFNKFNLNFLRDGNLICTINDLKLEKGLNTLNFNNCSFEKDGIYLLEFDFFEGIKLSYELQINLDKKEDFIIEESKLEFKENLLFDFNNDGILDFKDYNILKDFLLERKINPEVRDYLRYLQRVSLLDLNKDGTFDFNDLNLFEGYSFKKDENILLKNSITEKSNFTSYKEVIDFIGQVENVCNLPKHDSGLVRVDLNENLNNRGLSFSEEFKLVYLERSTVVVDDYEFGPDVFNLCYDYNNYLGATFIIHSIDVENSFIEISFSIE